MFKGIASAIGKMAGGTARASGEGLEMASKSSEAMASVTKPVIEAAPVPTNVISFANFVEKKAAGGANGPRDAFKELANPHLEGVSENEEEQEESAPPPQQKKENLLMSAAREAMTAPEVNQNPLTGLKSQVIERLPEAAGESADNTPKAA